MLRIKFQTVIPNWNLAAAQTPGSLGLVLIDLIFAKYHFCVVVCPSSSENLLFGEITEDKGVV